MIKNGIELFLKKTAKEFKTDICGFGKEAQRKFLDWNSWERYQWLKKYENSTFEVEVDLKIRRPGLIIRSVYPENIYQLEGEKQ